ncbi:MAG: hypothetical protein ACFB5Z_11520 [Elainellaceae cyanobacterium]
MWFITSFAIAIGAAWAYARFETVSEELAILCVGVALACVLLTLVSAPWPVQLALVAVLLTTQWVQQKGLLS